MAGAVSPSSSPRLPSPPPIAEDQVGPTSPGLPLFDDHGNFPGASGPDAGSARRIRRGTKSEDMAEGPPLVDLQDVGDPNFQHILQGAVPNNSSNNSHTDTSNKTRQIDSAFQLTEHLKSLYHTYTHPASSPNSTRPLTAPEARKLTQPPPQTSREIWLYELGRFLIQKTNAIIVALFSDSPPCSAQTCPEMRASEWQYLCAVHDPPKSCAAIDYCCHTLDGAATTLTSSKMFPSRLGLGSGSGGDSNSNNSASAGQTAGGSGTGVASDKMLQQQMREIKNIFRRVYRIYAHAWFQHREMFWRVESKTGLYVLFKMVCDEYAIIESESYTIPPEAEGGSEPVPTPTQGSAQQQQQPVGVLKREVDGANSNSGGNAAQAVSGKGRGDEEEVAEQQQGVHTVLPMGDTTKRHRHTMSDRSASISTVIQEEAEDEDEEGGDGEGRGQIVEQDPVPSQSLGRQGTVIRSLGEPVTTTTEVPPEDDDKDEDDNDDDEEEEVNPAIISSMDTVKPVDEAESENKEGQYEAQAAEEEEKGANFPEALPDPTVVEVSAQADSEVEAHEDVGSADLLGQQQQPA